MAVMTALGARFRRLDRRDTANSQIVTLGAGVHYIPDILRALGGLTGSDGSRRLSTVVSEERHQADVEVRPSSERVNYLRSLQPVGT